MHQLFKRGRFSFDCTACRQSRAGLAKRDWCFNMKVEKGDLRDLRDEGDIERIRLINNEIDLATTFLKLAHTEEGLDGGESKSLKLIAMARRAYDTAASLLTKVESPVERQRLEGKHRQLGKAIPDRGL